MREFDHAPPSTAEVIRMRGAVTPLPLYVFLMWTKTALSFPLTLNLPLNVSRNMPLTEVIK